MGIAAKKSEKTFKICGRCRQIRHLSPAEAPMAPTAGKWLSKRWVGDLGNRTPVRSKGKGEGNRRPSHHQSVMGASAPLFVSMYRIFLFV